uniref:Succinate-semialdehyde dehydrogenase, mitochondrial n=1 Tax=Populus trichocarpa TaxID=3694 RepID=A0A2K1ZDV7_POPTR
MHHVQVRKITFAGSTAVGKKFMAGAAGTVKRLASKFRNRGQTCVCANRIIGQEGIFDKFADAFSKAVQRMLVGDGFSKGVAQIGGECALTSQTGGLDF